MTIGAKLSLDDWRLIVVALALLARNKKTMLRDDQLKRCKEMSLELAGETGKYIKP